jgi:hypothetical protein
MPDEHTEHDPTKRRLPDEQFHPRLSDPGWQEEFRQHVHNAYQAERTRLASHLVPIADHDIAFVDAQFHIGLLWDFLVRTAPTSGPAPTSESSPTGLCHGPAAVLKAYRSVCRMIAEGVSRSVSESTRLSTPIRSLAHIDAILSGGDPVGALKEIDDLIGQRSTSGTESGNRQTPENAICCSQAQLARFLKQAQRGHLAESLEKQEILAWQGWRGGKLWVVFSNKSQHAEFREFVQNERSKKARKPKTVE